MMESVPKEAMLSQTRWFSLRASTASFRSQKLDRDGDGQVDLVTVGGSDDTMTVFPVQSGQFEGFLGSWRGQQGRGHGHIRPPAPSGGPCFRRIR